jgi:hypothetical protein
VGRLGKSEKSSSVGIVLSFEGEIVIPEKPSSKPVLAVNCDFMLTKGSSEVPLVVGVQFF